jgi:hypothetical protein
VQKTDCSNQETEKGHGRIETSKCEVITNLESLYGREKWDNLTIIIHEDTFSQTAAPPWLFKNLRRSDSFGLIKKMKAKINSIRRINHKKVSA